jgi:hypothetical protein
MENIRDLTLLPLDRKAEAKTKLVSAGVDAVTKSVVISSSA